MSLLNQLFLEHRGKVTDKWQSYIDEYEILLQPYRERNVRLLEIGIQNGGSLEIWRQYFPYAEKIVGCDIELACAKLLYDQSVSVVVGDVNSDEAEQTILKNSPSFDLIIDDGSHRSGDIIRAFVRYFRHLNQDALYIVEDLHCSYWKDYEGGLFCPYSSINFFKSLIDIVSYQYWGVEQTRCSSLKIFSDHYGIAFNEEELSHIHSINFKNSICVLTKHHPAKNILGNRIIAGTEALVCDDPLKLKNFVKLK